MLKICDSKSICAVVSVLITVAGSQPALAWWPFKSSEEKLAEACEQVLSERLKSPSSYRRTELIGPTVSSATWEESQGWNFEERKKHDEAFMSRNSEAKHSMDLSKRLWESGNYKLVRLGIRYEAANSFGASIAGAAVCTGPVRDGDDIAEIDPSSLRINGYTSFDWSIAQIGTSN